MKIAVDWHNPEKTILSVKLERNWYWEDMYQAAKDINNLLDTVTHPVCTFYDFTNAFTIPPNSLTHIKSLNRNVHPNQSRVAVIGLNLFGRSIINMFVTLYGAMAKGADFRVVATVAEAYEFFGIEMITGHET